jgi:hypothetical protein
MTAQLVSMSHVSHLITNQVASRLVPSFRENSFAAAAQRPAYPKDSFTPSHSSSIFLFYTLYTLYKKLQLRLKELVPRTITSERYSASLPCGLPHAI